MGNQCCNSDHAAEDDKVVEPKELSREPSQEDNNKQTVHEPQDEPKEMTRSGLELVFKAKESTVMRFKTPEQSILNGIEANAIVRAWLGDSANEWDKKKGKDVTKQVKKLLKQKKEVKLDDNSFGKSPKNAMKVPSGNKVLLIEVMEDVVKTFNFVSKPLGITLKEKKLPIVVTKVIKNGNGYNLGIQEGMTLMKVDGENILGMNYLEVIALIQKGMVSLNSLT